MLSSAYSMLTSWFHEGGHHYRRERELLRNYPKLPVPIVPLQECDLKYELENRISDGGIRASMHRISRSISEEEPPTKQTPNSSETSEPPPPPVPTKYNSVELILAREAGLGTKNNWTSSQQRCTLCPTNLPSYPTNVVDNLRGHAYIGKYSTEGEYYVTCLQDQRILVYKPDEDWELQKHITARMLRWTITDTCFSHNANFLLYSTISPVLHIVKIQGDDNIVDSQANITEIHEPIIIGEEDGQEMFAIWSIAWSKTNNEILVGTSCSSQHICLYDMQEQRTTASIPGHQDDVNAVVYLDDASQVFASGSDDSLIKVWDKRVFRAGTHSIAGALIGHTEGLTHLDSKKDGRYLISNAKDQTIKLWDLRKMSSTIPSPRLLDPPLPQFFWDYRTSQYPGLRHEIRHPLDSSLMTFRGHSVLRTLIRSYFSPQFSTGQRYIYTGCHSGTIRIYDVLTGETVKTLKKHRSVVRDCSWHPYNATIVSTSWDGRMIEWTPQKSYHLDADDTKSYAFFPRLTTAPPSSPTFSNGAASNFNGFARGIGNSTFGLRTDTASVATPALSAGAGQFLSSGGPRVTRFGGAVGATNTGGGAAISGLEGLAAVTGDFGAQSLAAVNDEGLSAAATRIRGNRVGALQFRAASASRGSSVSPSPVTVTTSPPSTTVTTSPPTVVTTSPPSNDCSSVPGCATCFVNSAAGGGITCTTCSAGFALRAGGVNCDACSQVASCTECDTDPATPGNVICTACGSGTTLETATGVAPVPAPTCVACSATPGCLACFDGQPAAAGGILCTSCASGTPPTCT
eukprot:g4910.t1